MTRKFISLCMAILLILGCPCTAFAAQLDQNRTGTIAVTLASPDQNVPVIGAELSVYYVATVASNSQGEFIFACTDEFEPFSDVLDAPSLVDLLDSYVDQYAYDLTSIQITTDDQGVAMCDGLPLGLYFVKQSGKADGFTDCRPFLVTIPNENNGEYQYEVNAAPKTEVSRLVSITVRKEWNTDDATPEADSVTVELLNGEEVVETAVLSALNNWQVTYPDMPQSDAYSIREVNIPQGFTATYRQEEYVFSVTNTSNLIHTGQLTWLIPVLAVCGMLLLAVGIVLIRKKRTTDA